MTQREEPRLALIETALAADCLQLRASGAGVLSVSRTAAGAQVEVICWRDRCAAFDAGDQAADWLTALLGSPARLVRFDARRKRSSNKAWTGGQEALTQFADAFAWLVVSQASLDDLNRRLTRPLPMNRFRPNIVVDGLPAYGEDDVHEFSAGGVRLRVTKPCARCAVTTTNQMTGEREGDEPLRTLKGYRYDAELKGLIFGQNLMLAGEPGGELRVGQPLDIIMKQGL